MDLFRKQAATHAFIEAERCVVELQRGRGIVLYDASEKSLPRHVFQLVETMSKPALESLMVSHDCQLVIAGARAAALGVEGSGAALRLPLKQGTPASYVHFWSGLNPEADIASRKLNGTQSPVTVQNQNAFEQEMPELQHIPGISELGDISGEDGRFAQAALNLAQQAHVLPALISYRVQDVDEKMLAASVQQARQYREQGGDLMTLSHASIPSKYADNITLTVFREQHGGAEHVAIMVGQPDLSGPVSVRLHSSCFTGDILGSLKCDCGEQLQRAIETMAESHGGVVLYVSQEGRGIGLSSKLLAYQLQDMGLDTIEANQQLGFTADERRYSAAVNMLEKLGINSISLMTNNPLKIEALKAQGIDVVSRTPSPATVNVHNARYLETKRTRSGHLASCET